MQAFPFLQQPHASWALQTLETSQADQVPKSESLACRRQCTILQRLLSQGSRMMHYEIVKCHQNPIRVQT